MFSLIHGFIALTLSVGWYPLAMGITVCKLLGRNLQSNLGIVDAESRHYPSFAAAQLFPSLRARFLRSS